MLQDFWARMYTYIHWFWPIKYHRNYVTHNFYTMNSPFSYFSIFHPSHKPIYRSLEWRHACKNLGLAFSDRLCFPSFRSAAAHGIVTHGDKEAAGGVAGNIRKAARSFSKVAALRPMRAYARLSRVSTVDPYSYGLMLRARMSVYVCMCCSVSENRSEIGVLVPFPI